jgi:hypothetical protein
MTDSYDLEQRLEKAEWVLNNAGFRRCDIPACNCGSWHQVGGYRARFDEIKEAVEEADYSTNGKTLLDVVKEVIADAKRTGDVAQSAQVQDVRWAVNVLLEKIADGFEKWETADIWRSDAAAYVRSQKHALAAQPPAAPVETEAEVMERRRKGLPDYEKPPIGMDWKLSEYAEQTIAEIERNIREAPANIARHNGSSAGNEPVVWRVRYCGQWMYFENKTHAEIYAQGDDNIEPLYLNEPQTASKSAVEQEMDDNAEYLKQSGIQATRVTVEGLADWFYDHGWEFVVADDEEVVKDLLKSFDIAPKSSRLSRPEHSR